MRGDGCVRRRGAVHRGMGVGEHVHVQLYSCILPRNVVELRLPVFSRGTSALQGRKGAAGEEASLKSKDWVVFWKRLSSDSSCIHTARPHDRRHAPDESLVLEMCNGRAAPQRGTVLLLDAGVDDAQCCSVETHRCINRWYVHFQWMEPRIVD